MDCFAVSIASGIILKRVQLRPMLIMALAFGFFQALMPLLGWIGASFFSHLIESIDHWIAFAILAFLGGRMIMESFKDEDCRHEFDPTKLKVVAALAVATSIDALAVGITLAFLNVALIPSVTFIGVTTFVISAIGIRIGNIFGMKYKSRAEFAGGVILICIGLKILLEHLGILG